MRRLPRELLLGAAAVLTFLGVDGATDLKWWVAAVLGVLVYVGGSLLVPLQHCEREIELAPGVTKADAESAVREGLASAESILQLSRLVMEDDLAEKIERVGHVAQEICWHVKEDPGDLPELRGFFDRHLPWTLKLLQDLSRMRQLGHLTAGEKERIATVESRLDEIQEAFETQLRTARAHDIDGLHHSVESLAILMELDAEATRHDAPERRRRRAERRRER